MEDNIKKEDVKIESIQLKESEAEETSKIPNMDGMDKIIHQKRYSRAIKMDREENENKNENFLLSKNVSKSMQPSKTGEQGFKNPLHLNEKHPKILADSVDSANIKSNNNTATINFEKSNFESNHVSNPNFIHGNYASNPSNQYSLNSHKVDYSNIDRKEDNESVNTKSVFNKSVKSYRNLHFETLDKFKNKIHHNKYKSLNIQIKPKEKEFEVEGSGGENNLGQFKPGKIEKEKGSEKPIRLNESRKIVKKNPGLIYSSHNTNILKRDRKINTAEAENESENEEFEIEDPYAYFEVKNNFSNKISRFLLKSKDENDNFTKKNLDKNVENVLTLESENEEDYSQNEIKIENVNDRIENDNYSERIEHSEYPNKNEQDSKLLRHNRNKTEMSNRLQIEEDMKEIVPNDLKENDLSQDIINEEDGDIKSRGGIVILKPNIFPQIKSKEEIEDTHEQELLIQPRISHNKDLLQITIKRIENCVRLIQKTWRIYKSRKILNMTKIQSYWRAFKLRQKFSPVLYYYYIFWNQIKTLQNFLNKRTKKIAFFKIFYLDKFEFYCHTLDKLRCLVLMRRSRKKFIYLQRDLQKVLSEKNDRIINEPFEQVSIKYSVDAKTIQDNEILDNNQIELPEKNLKLDTMSYKILRIPKFLSHSNSFRKSYRDKYSERMYIKKIQYAWRHMAPLIKLQSHINKKLSDIKIIKKKSVIPPETKTKISVYNYMLVIQIQRKLRNFLKRQNYLEKSKESVKNENVSCLLTPKISPNPKFIREKVNTQNTMEFVNSLNLSNLSIGSNIKINNYSENNISSKWTNKNLFKITKIHGNLSKFTKTENNLNTLKKRITKIQRFVKNTIKPVQKEENKNIPKELYKISEIISQNIEINIEPLKVEGDIITEKDIPIKINKIPPIYLTKEIKFISESLNIETEDLKIKQQEIQTDPEELKNETANEVTESPEPTETILPQLLEESKSTDLKMNSIELILILKNKFEATTRLCNLFKKSSNKTIFQDLREYHLNDVAKQLFSILVKRKRIHSFLIPEFLIKIKRRIMLIDFIFTVDQKIRNKTASFFIKKLKRHAENEKHKLFLENLYRQMHMEYLNSIQTFLKLDKDELEMQVEIKVEDELLNYGYNLYEHKKNRENKKWYQSPEMSLIASWDSKKVEELKDSMNESAIFAERRKDDYYRKNNKLEFIKNSLRRNNRSKEEAEMKLISSNIEINFSY